MCVCVSKEKRTRPHFECFHFCQHHECCWVSFGEPCTAEEYSPIMDTILGCRKAKPYDVYLSKAVKRVFRSDTKDYVTVCAVGRSAFVRCPATSAVEMRIRRSVLHLELQCMPGKNFSLEANVTVSSKRSAKKLDVRFAFSSTIERLSVKKSFAQLPLDMSSLLRHTDGSVGSSAEDSPEASQSCDSPPWIHVFLNFQALVHKLYGKKMGFRFEAVHSLQINAHVKLRRVYFTDSVQPVPGPTPAPESITGAPSVPLLDLTLLDHPDGELLVNASLLSDRHNSSADSSSTFASPLVPRHRNTEQRPASPLHEFEARDVAAGQSQDELLDNENDASSEDSSNQRNFREEDKSNPAGSTSADDPGLADDEGVAAASNPLKSDTSFNPWDNGRSSASMSARRAALQQRAAPTLAQRRATSGDTEHDIPALPKPTGQNDLLRSTDSLLEEIEAQQRKIAAMVDGDDGSFSQILNY